MANYLTKQWLYPLVSDHLEILLQLFIKKSENGDLKPSRSDSLGEVESTLSTDKRELESESVKESKSNRNTRAHIDPVKFLKCPSKAKVLELIQDPLFFTAVDCKFRGQIVKVSSCPNKRYPGQPYIVELSDGKNSIITKLPDQVMENFTEDRQTYTGLIGALLVIKKYRLALHSVENTNPSHYVHMILEDFGFAGLEGIDAVGEPVLISERKSVLDNLKRLDDWISTLDNGVVDSVNQVDANDAYRKEPYSSMVDSQFVIQHPIESQDEYNQAQPETEVVEDLPVIEVESSPAYDLKATSEVFSVETGPADIENGALFEIEEPEEMERQSSLDTDQLTNDQCSSAYLDRPADLTQSSSSLSNQERDDGASFSKKSDSLSSEPAIHFGWGAFTGATAGDLVISDSQQQALNDISFFQDTFLVDINNPESFVEAVGAEKQVPESIEIKNSVPEHNAQETEMQEDLDMADGFQTQAPLSEAEESEHGIDEQEGIEILLEEDDLFSQEPAEESVDGSLLEVDGNQKNVSEKEIQIVTAFEEGLVSLGGLSKMGIDMFDIAGVDQEMNQETAQEATDAQEFMNEELENLMEMICNDDSENEDDNALYMDDLVADSDDEDRLVVHTDDEDDEMFDSIISSQVSTGDRAVPEVSSSSGAMNDFTTQAPISQIEIHDTTNNAQTSLNEEEAQEPFEDSEFQTQAPELFHSSDVEKQLFVEAIDDDYDENDAKEDSVPGKNDAQVDSASAKNDAMDDSVPVISQENLQLLSKEDQISNIEAITEENVLQFLGVEPSYENEVENEMVPVISQESEKERDDDMEQPTSSENAENQVESNSQNGIQTAESNGMESEAVVENLKAFFLDHKLEDNGLDSEEELDSFFVEAADSPRSKSIMDGVLNFDEENSQEGRDDIALTESTSNEPVQPVVENDSVYSQQFDGGLAQNRMREISHLSSIGDATNLQSSPQLQATMVTPQQVVVRSEVSDNNYQHGLDCDKDPITPSQEKVIPTRSNDIGKIDLVIPKLDIMPTAQAKKRDSIQMPSMIPRSRKASSGVLVSNQSLNQPEDSSLKVATKNDAEDSQINSESVENSDQVLRNRALFYYLLDKPLSKVDVVYRPPPSISKNLKKDDRRSLPLNKRSFDDGADEVENNGPVRHGTSKNSQGKRRKTDFVSFANRRI